MTKFILPVLLMLAASPLAAQQRTTPLVRVVDLNLNETQELQLHNGQSAAVQLLAMREQRDRVMGALRQVEVDVVVNGQKATLVSGLYRLPQLVGGVQVDCPVTSHYNRDSHINHWGLEKQARFRIWPKDSPWIRPSSFVYPVGQRWFASQTWFSNEAVSPRPPDQFYYHAGLDLGGSELQVPVFAATDGRVVSVGDQYEEDLPKAAVKPRYDVVYLQDERGWYYRYSHLSAINTPVQLGATVKAGQQIGTIGKEGGSGGWSHLHFEIKSLQPSGLWGTQDGYAFLWQAYQQQFAPEVIAVARPRHLVQTGESVTLDGSRSWSRNAIREYQWTFTDGSTATGSQVKRVYDEPGTYNEILTVTDDEGNSAVDFAIVRVVDETRDSPPGLHAAYFPSHGVQVGDPVMFNVRARNTTEGYDVWDFGDGSPEVTVRSNVDPSSHAEVGYAGTVHRFRKAGRYIVSVRRETSSGTATDRLVVHVE